MKDILPFSLISILVLLSGCTAVITTESKDLEGEQLIKKEFYVGPQLGCK